MQHPDITSALKTGYPRHIQGGNRDCPETRAEYIDDNSHEFMAWVRRNYPELAEEYIEENQRDYNNWLN